MNIIERGIITLADKLEAKRNADLKDFCINNCIVAEGKGKPGMATFTTVANKFGVSRQKVVAMCFQIADEFEQMARDDAAIEARRDKADVDAEFKAQTPVTEADNGNVNQPTK